MKTGLHTLGLLLAGLLAVVIIGCGPDDEDVMKTEGETPTPEEKLAGEYKLIQRETDHVEDQWDQVDKPPDYEATLILIHGGSVVMSGVYYGAEVSEHADTWSATATTITIGDDTRSYTLQGTTLTIIFEDDRRTATEKWKKIK